MILTHMIACRVWRPIPEAVSQPIGRRRRTRTYRTPAPTAEALADSYEALREAAPEAVKALIGPYLLRGDVLPGSLPPAAAIDWGALMNDAETVVQLFDAYLEYVEEEDLSILLLND